MLTHSFALLKNQLLGFEPAGVLTLHVPLPPAKYAKPEQIRAFYSETLSGVAALPAVESAAVSSALPLNESRLAHVLPEGSPAVPLAQRRLTAVQSITPLYLRVMKIPLLQGRPFTESDKRDGARVALVNRTFAQTFFPGQDPLGKHVSMGSANVSWRIIGDIRNVSLSSPPQAEIDLPFAQLPLPQMNLLVRSARGEVTAGLTGAIRAQVSHVDPEQPLTDVQSLDSLLAQSRSQPRLVTTVLLLVAGLALVLAAVGVYSVVSHNTAQRLPEFGVRIALGASRQDLIFSVLKQASRLAAAGIGIGLLAAFACARIVAHHAFGVGRFDPLSFAAGPALFFLVSLGAAFCPALRSTRWRPADVLRAE